MKRMLNGLISFTNNIYNYMVVKYRHATIGTNSKICEKAVGFSLRDSAHNQSLLSCAYGFLLYQEIIPCSQLSKKIDYYCPVVNNFNSVYMFC